MKCENAAAQQKIHSRKRSERSLANMRSGVNGSAWIAALNWEEDLERQEVNQLRISVRDDSNASKLGGGTNDVIEQQTQTNQT